MAAEGEIPITVHVESVPTPPIPITSPAFQRHVIGTSADSPSSPYQDRTLTSSLETIPHGSPTNAAEGEIPITVHVESVPTPPIPITSPAFRRHVIGTSADSPSSPYQDRTLTSSLETIPHGSPTNSNQRELWLKACLVLEVLTICVRPFVGRVMEKFHKKAIEKVKFDVKTDLGVCEDIDWDCSTLSGANDTKFSDEAPIAFKICSIDTDGLAKTETPHHLKSGSMERCRLKNVPEGLFDKTSNVSSRLDVFMYPNPDDYDNPKSDTFYLLPSIAVDDGQSVLAPFCVSRCMPREPALQYHVVLCSSHPSLTEKLVQSKLDGSELPQSHPKATLDFAFWTLTKDSHNSRKKTFHELRHNFKQGNVVVFSGNVLPSGIQEGLRYIVAEVTKLSFRVSGPIACPVSKFTSPLLEGHNDAFVVVRRSPVARFRDIARAYHMHASESKLKWPGIRAAHLSERHGEFCKFFCSQTSRDLDFFEESAGNRCAEQLFNMISMCIAFSSCSQDKTIGVDTDGNLKNSFEMDFCSLFSELEPHHVISVGKALADLRHAAVGHFSSGKKVFGVRDIRNKMFHDFLTLNSEEFEALLTASRKLLEALRDIDSCMKWGNQTVYEEQAIRKIFGPDGIVKRNMETPDLFDYEILKRQRQDMLDELEKKHEQRMNEMINERQQLQVCLTLGRKIDSFAICLRKDLEANLVLTNRIGRTGGQGNVYKVNHWGQSFAVKIFKGDAHERAWLRELGSMSFLSHSNIVRMFYIVYDSIDDRARAHPPAGFAMELMARSAGDNISCTTEQLLELFIQIAGALSYSHDLGVVHFDVKPENILLNESCTVAKLCDFGCAHKLQIAAASASTSAMTFRGTLMYMAPEVINGNVVDAKLCDIYSFGKTMFSLLDPKANASVMISMQQCNTSHLVHVPEALRRLIEMCTDENFAKRPQSMTQIFRKLQEIQKISRLSLFQQNESCEPLVDIPTIRLRPRLLLANGVSLNELDRIGYSAAELKEDGCSAKDICDYFPTEVIKDLGFSPLLLLECGSENFKKLHGFFTAGYTIHELKNAGFSAQQFLALVNYGDFQSQQYITSISELDVRWLIEGGFSFSVLRRCNFDASTLANSGCNAQQLKDAGFTVQQLKQAGLAPKWLLAGGWTAAELSSRLGDSATFSVSEMHEAGADPKSLAECGYTRRDLLACGYQLSQLSDAGMSTSCSLRDCCINVFDYAGCDQIPRASDEENEDSWQFIFWPLVPFQILWLGFWLILSSRPNDCRFFNWFFHPFDAFLGMHTLTNLATTLEFRYFKENDFCKEWCCICAQPFYFFISFVGLVYGWVCSVFSILGCLPCCICFNLSRFVWKYKSSCNDSVFWIIYTCMLHMAMSGRWLWKILCCRRSCFGLARGPCGPSCKLNHGDDPCILCGRPSSQHGDLWHSCLDGRRGSFLWTGIE